MSSIHLLTQMTPDSKGILQKVSDDSDTPLRRKHYHHPSEYGKERALNTSNRSDKNVCNFIYYYYLSNVVSETGLYKNE